MEVHHHPTAEKKNFKEYFLEFVMIFLAVTMGFYAEGIRENISDYEKEKEFMQSLVRDIKDDTAILNSQQKAFQQRVVLLDSLVIALHANSLTDNTSNIYYYGRMATKSYGFPANTRTIDQIKSTGGYRVIKNANIVDEIMSYYAIVGNVHELDATDEGEMNEYRKIAVQIFDAVVFNNINSSGLDIVTRPFDNPPLRTSDKKLLGDLAGWVHYIKNTRIGIYQYKKNILVKGEKLIQLIQKEYHFESEL